MKNFDRTLFSLPFHATTKMKRWPGLNFMNGKLLLCNKLSFVFFIAAMSTGMHAYASINRNEIVNFDFLSSKLYANTIFLNFNPCFDNGTGGGGNYNPGKRGDERDTLVQQSRYLDSVEAGITFFRKGTYNTYLPLLDTSLNKYFKDYYLTLRIFQRMINEGKHNHDINEQEYNQLNYIYKNEWNLNASWDYVDRYLLGYWMWRDYKSSVLPTKPNQTEITLFPNPAKEAVTIEWKEGFKQAKVLVYDASGKLVWQLNWLQNIGLSINTSAWQSGSYLIKVQTQDGETHLRKLLINK